MNAPSLSHLIQTLAAFFWGVREFRSDLTRHYEDLDHSESYDKGRDLAHALTFRRFDR